MAREQKAALSLLLAQDVRGYNLDQGGDNWRIR